MAIGHSGSWFGLPDFGVTEKIGGVLGKPLSNTGSSNLSSSFGNTAATNNNYVSTNPSQNVFASYAQKTPSPQWGIQQPGVKNTGSATGSGTYNTNLAAPSPSGPSPEEMARQEQYRREEALRNEIGSGWDSYLSSLSGMLGDTSQLDTLTGMANTDYDQNVNQLDLSKTQGLQSLGQQRERVGTNQTRTLRDLAGNIKNSMMAGNIYLGARGAGDSSAANQYSYALTKEGTRQRTDVMNKSADLLGEIDARETNLNNIYDSEVRNLDAERDKRIGEVTLWFQGQQDAIRQAIATGQLSKSQDLASLSKDLLNEAMRYTQTIDADYRDRRKGLESWALTNSQNLAQLKSNLQGISSFNPGLPQAGPVAGQPQVDSQGNFRVATGYGGGTDEQRNSLFQNPAWRT